MYNKINYKKTSIEVNQSVEGESIEQKIERVVNNNEPITDGAPIIYTERKEGVQPGYDIRTDRFEVALDAMDKVAATHRGKREERQKKIVEDYNKNNGSTEPNNGGTESTQGQDKTT